MNKPITIKHILVGVTVALSLIAVYRIYNAISTKIYNITQEIYLKGYKARQSEEQKEEWKKTCSRSEILERENATRRQYPEVQFIRFYETSDCPNP